MGLKQGYRYLIQRKADGKNQGNVREWECLEVAGVAYKVQDKVGDRHSSIFSAVNIDNPFWVFKSSIDTLGNAEYQIIEELGII